MQDHFHHVQELHEVEIWLLWYRFRFTSTRAHGVPFLHTPGAHLTTPFHGAIAVGAMLPPTPPSDIFPYRIACILRMFSYLCRQVNAVCRL